MTAHTPTPAAREAEKHSPGSRTPRGRDGATALRVAGVALLSADAERLAGFYERSLGLSFELRRHDGGREHHVLQLAGVQVEIKSTRSADGRPSADATPGRDVGSAHPTGELSFEVGDVDRAIDKVVACGGSVQQQAADFPWGRYAVALDPDGNRLGLYAPPAPGHAAHDDEREVPA